MKILHISDAGVAKSDYTDAETRAVAMRAGFEKAFNKQPTRCFSAPGRTELSGNHTDHQGGRVLAAAVALDALAVVAPNDENIIRVISPGFPNDCVELASLEPIAAEAGTSAAVIRGVCAWFKRNGYAIGGFDAIAESAVPVGSGLSSSAAFEVLTGAILNGLYNGGAVPNERLAIAGKFAENVYFMKPSGLMDQMASAMGGVTAMDFYDAENPKLDPVTFDLASCGFALCITMTGGSHADLTSDYADIPDEMRAVAAYFGEDILSRIDPDAFYKALPKLRDSGVGDRAILRTMHFIEENRRVPMQLEALRSGDFDAYLALVRQSGDSSYKYLQNIYSPSNPQEQGVAIALSLSEKVLDGEGASRVHGGGFAGTIQAYVPTHKLETYTSAMDAVFGDGACRALELRQAGACEITL